MEFGTKSKQSEQPAFYSLPLQFFGIIYVILSALEKPLLWA